jgi:DNA repair photolyase
MIPEATIMKKNIIFHDKPGKALTPQKKVDRHNLPFTLNATIGCHFGCSYCYLQSFPFNLHTVFGEEVKVKLWIAQGLDRDLDKYRDLPQHLKRVQVNPATEGYLPAVMTKTKRQLGRDIMREVLRVFDTHWQDGNPWMVHLVTKSHMILKHTELLAKMRDQVQVELTLTCLDEGRRRQLEGCAPSVNRRLNVIERLSEAGIFVRVMCMPLIGTREECEELRQVAFERGATAFKHKGLNYWSEEDVVDGKPIRIKGQENLVYEDLLVKSE